MVAVRADTHDTESEESAFHEATPEEGEVMLDQRAQRYLGISGLEFIRRWEAGYYDADPDAHGVQNIVGMLAFVQHLLRAT